MRDLIPNLQIYTTSRTVLQVPICIFPLLPFFFLFYIFHAVLHSSIYTEINLSMYKMCESTGPC